MLPLPLTPFSYLICSVSTHFLLAPQVFVASALMEWHHDNSNVKVPKNIWELGAKRFMAEPAFVLAYIDFQLGLGDTANCRATFERALTVTPPPQAKPLWDQYLRFEAQVGCHSLKLQQKLLQWILSVHSV